MDMNRITALLEDAHRYVAEREYVERILVSASVLSDGTVMSDVSVHNFDGSKVSLNMQTRDAEVRDAGA